MSDQCGTLKNPHPQHRGHTEDEETRPAEPQGDTLHGDGMDERQYHRYDNPYWQANDDVTMDITAQRGWIRNQMNGDEDPRRQEDNPRTGEP